MGMSGKSFPLLGDTDFERDNIQYSPRMGSNAHYLNYFPGCPAVKLAVAMHKFALLKDVNEAGLEERTRPLLMFQGRLLEWCLLCPKKQSQRVAGCRLGWGMPVRQWETTGCGAGLALPGAAGTMSLW